MPTFIPIQFEMTKPWDFFVVDAGKHDLL